MVDFANFFFAHITWFALGFIVLVFFAFAAYLENRGSSTYTPPQTPPEPPLTTYGSASFALARADLPGGEEHVFRGVFFGKSSYEGAENMPLGALNGAPVCSKPGHHSIIFAKTGTGKGTRVIIPTLLRACLTSAIVIDPKGENAVVTGNARRSPPIDKLYTYIRVINPWGVMGPTLDSFGYAHDTYNPLDILDRNDPNVVANAQALAAAICPIEKGGKDAYWTSSAATVLTAVLLYLTDQPGETKNLGRARQIVTMTRKQFTDEFLVKMAASSAFEGAMREHAAPFIDLAQETYSGVMSNLAEHTKFLSDPQVKAATATSTISMQSLLNRLSTFYLVIPPEKMDVQRTWLRLMITAALQTYKNAPAGVKRNRCLFLIDELPALGRLPDLPRDIALMRGYGVDFCLIVQGLSQLKDTYGNDADTIINNCSYQWYCNINDLQTAEYLSKMLGKKTVETFSTSDSTNSPLNMGKGGSTSTSMSKSFTGRALLTPDEILTLGRDAAILIAPGEKPNYLRTVDYWNLKQAFQSLRQQYPRIYCNPPLRWDDNPLHH